MMTLFFGQFPHAVDECERLLEILKFELPSEVMFIDALPIGDLFVQFGQVVTFKRWDTDATRKTCFGRERRHGAPRVARFMMRRGRSSMPENSPFDAARCLFAHSH